MKNVVIAENVKKSFGTNPVLKDVSMTVRQGEVVVLMGPSGTGKSTFLRTINFLEVPDDGRINFDGVEIGKDQKTLRKARTKMAFVSQSYNLFPHMTAMKNVMYPLMKIGGMEKNEAFDEASMMLDRVGLSDKFESYPGQLSGGQQQRVAIARAMAMKPILILFDEPTSALDPEMTSEVLGVMRELASDGVTMITVTHEINFARDVADRIVFMHGGYILEDSTPEIFFNSPRTEQAMRFMTKIA